MFWIRPKIKLICCWKLYQRQLNTKSNSNLYQELTCGTIRSTNSKSRDETPIYFEISYPCQSPHRLCWRLFTEISQNHVENAAFGSRAQRTFVHRTAHQFRVSNHNIWIERNIEIEIEIWNNLKWNSVSFMTLFWAVRKPLGFLQISRLIQ